MKKLFFSTFLLLLLVSCSNVAEVEIVTPEDETLKNFIVNKESDISWTKELESDRLRKDIYRDEKKIVHNIHLKPEVVTVAYKDSEPVYPSLSGFGSLDISDLPENVKSVVNGFCKSLSANIYEGPGNFVDSSYFFNYVFFKNDLIDSWKGKFGVDFPQVLVEEEDSEETNEGEDKNITETEPKSDDEKSTDENNKEKVDSEKENLEKDNKETNEQKDGEKTEGEKESEKIKKPMPPLFSSWILGRPFISQEILQQPVRFYCQQGFVDVTLYINLENNKIYQITEGPYDGTK